MEIDTITLLGGRGRSGQAEPVGAITLTMGQVVSVVGPTGSGKSALINDIALFAKGDTPSGRRVLINGEPPATHYLEDAAANPVALITQHTTFLSDLPVARFLAIHARVRRGLDQEGAVAETLAFADRLTGEPINHASAMTELSGGQTRALLIADAVVIGNTPIILLDEIENAGIDREEALALLKTYRKIFLFVTHDLGIALHSDTRLVMADGAMKRVVPTNGEERRVALRIQALDQGLARLREAVRRGEQLDETQLDAALAAATLPGGPPP